MDSFFMWLTYTLGDLYVIPYGD